MAYRTFNNGVVLEITANEIERRLIKVTVVKDEDEDSIFTRRKEVHYTAKNWVALIDASAFYQCEELVSVTFPGLIQEIGDKAFYNCQNLESVSFDCYFDSEIGEYAFYGCKALTELELPDGITKIGEGAFRYCGSLQKIVIPNTLTEIANATFADCSSLKEATLPERLTIIGNEAFKYCSSLEKIVLPKGLKAIKERAFYGCSSLKEIALPGNVKVIRIQKESISAEGINLKEKGFDFWVNDSNCELYIYISDQQQLSDIADEFRRLLWEHPEATFLFYYNTTEKECPYCGASMPRHVDVCPKCGGSVTDFTIEELDIYLKQFKEALEDFRRHENEETKKAIDYYANEIQETYSNNPKVREVLNGTMAEVEKIKQNNKQSDKIMRIMLIIIFVIFILFYLYRYFFTDPQADRENAIKEQLQQSKEILHQVKEQLH